MTSERHLEIARRWFTEGWRGDLPMAKEIFSEDLRTSGVHIAVAGPAGRPDPRAAGRLPDLSLSVGF
jgi:hypothetical protein